jgi:hypothetical protein
MKRIRVALTALLVGAFMYATPAKADVVCNTYSYTGHDDTAYPANLPFTLKLGLTEYENVFVTTNGTLTFGQPDATFNDYPQTPSVSVAGYDWVTFGQGAYVSFGSTANTLCVEWSLRPYPQSQGDLTQIRLVINKYPNGTWHGEVTTFGWLPADLRRGIRYEQGTPVVTIAGAFDVGDGGVPVEVTPAPTPSSFTEPPVVPTPEPSLEPTPEPTPSVEPEPVPSVVPSLNPEPTPVPEPTQEPAPVIPQEPTPEPTPTTTQTQLPALPSQPPAPPVQSTVEPEQPNDSSQSPLEPTLEPTPEPTPTPTPSVSEIAPVPVVEPTPTASDLVPNLEPTSEPTVEEVTQVVIEDALADGVLTDAERELVADALVTEFAGEPITFEALQEAGLDYEDLPPDQPVTLENGVVLTAEIADAIEIFESGAEVIGAILNDPAKALKAFVNVGADMTPEERETSQNTVVAAVVVTQVAQVRKIK